MRFFGGQGGRRARSGKNHAAIFVSTGKGALGGKADPKMSTEFHFVSQSIPIFSFAIFLPGI